MDNLNCTVMRQKLSSKTARSVDTLQFVKKKDDLPNLKLEIDKLDIDRLKTVPVDLTKLSKNF